MKHITLTRRAAWAMLSALGMLALLAGCAKRVTGVDAGYTTLEGHPDANARMLAWTDTPSTVELWADLGTPGPDPSPDFREDTLYALVPTYRTGPGTVYTTVLDKTAASGYQVFRRAANGGFQSLADYAIAPTVKWLATGWEMYSITDAHPSGYSPRTYIGRGLLSGKATTTSPVTNAAILGASGPTASITWRADSAVVAPTDSLFNMAWSRVDGAAGYWVQVYQFKSAATLEEKRASGQPNPVVSGNVNHIFLGYVQAGSSDPVMYRLGQPGAEVFTFVTPQRGQAYLARVTAVDGNGNVIAWMRGDLLFHQMTDFYEKIPLGAVLIQPTRQIRP